MCSVCHMHADALGDQKRASDALALETQEGVKPPGVSDWKSSNEL